MERVRLSVVLPAYNAACTIEACLSSLLIQTLPRDDYEIIVVDNGSTDDTAERARRYPVVYLNEPDKTVYGARNTGASASSGEALAFTDSDCIVDKRWLELGLQHLRECDLAAGRILPQPSSRKLLYAYDRLVRRSAVTCRSGDIHVAAGNAFVRRNVFENLGGFEEHLTTAGDSILSMRAHQEGYTVRFAPDAVVYHPVDHWVRRIRGMLREGYGSKIKAQYRGAGTKGLARRVHSCTVNALALVHCDLLSVRRALVEREVGIGVGLGVLGTALFMRALAYGSIVTARLFGKANRAFARR